MQDLEYFDDMVIDCYIIFAGTRKTINLTKEAFKKTGAKLNNVIFYEIKEKVIKNKLVKIEDKNLKMGILRELHIL